MPNLPALPLERDPSTTAVDAGALARLQVWAEAARDSLAPSTQRGYYLDGARFRGWCAKRERCPLPATPETVREFLLAELEERPYKVGTLRRRAASIAAMHRAADLPSPCDSALVRMTLKGFARSMGTGQRQAAPLTERDALRIRARMGETLRDARDLALLLVGRDLLARASELVALRVEDVAPAAEGDGVVIALRRRKTDTEARPYFIAGEAAEALRAYLDRAGITAGVMFRAVHKGGQIGRLGLSPRDVSRILKARATQAGLPEAAGVSGHSLRVGMAVDLVGANVEMPKVMQAGGWSSPAMVARYSAGVSAQRGAIASFYARR